jgi:hypothetical protein
MGRRPDAALVIAALAVAATLILVPVSVWLTLTEPGYSTSDPIDRVAFRLLGLTFGPVGLLIASRRPENRIAWILIALGLVVETSTAASSAAKIVADPFAATVLGHLGDFGWLAFITLACLLVLLYPDGRLPSRRWWPLGLALPGWLTLFLFAALLAPTTMHNGAPAPNPFGGAPGALGDIAQLILGMVLVLLFPLLVAVLIAAAVRWRRSIGVERQQLELFVYIAAVAAIGWALSASSLPGPRSLLVNLAMLALPVAIAVAILRYRLYDIDVLIERTLVYGALSATVALTYWLLVLLLQSALRPITSGSELAIAGSTLATLALVQPLRTRIQRAVDRRFYRRRYDAARAVDEFSVRLRDEVALDAVRSELLDAVGRTMQPATASLWLREQRP